MTAAETALWQSIRKRQLGPRFRRKAIIGPYIIDFLSHDPKLALLIAKPEDPQRTKFLRAEGFTLLHLPGHPDQALSRLKLQLKPEP